MPYATARWIVQNKRSQAWSGELASRDRDQIKAQIRSQTGAKEVIVQSVRGWALERCTAVLWARRC